MVLSVPMQEGTSSTALKLSRSLNKEDGVKPNPFLDTPQQQPGR